MLETHIVMSSLVFHLILTLVLHLALLLVLCLISLMDLTIAHMFLVNERIVVCLDALVMTDVLIMMIVSCVGMVFLLKSLTLTLSPDTWIVHVFLVVVLVPLVQRVRCKSEGPEKVTRGGEWEPIKTPLRNLAYIAESTRCPSLLTRPRPTSYG
jgi:hypothetical protein